MQQGWVIPRKNISTLCRSADSSGEEAAGLIDVGSVPGPPLGPRALDLNAGLLAYADGHTVCIVRGVTGDTQRETRVALRAGYRIHALAIREEIIYFGGEGRNLPLAFIDMRHPGRWFRVELPEEVRDPDMRVDAIAINGDRLFARSVPGYLLTYDVSDPCAPRHLETMEFPLEPRGVETVSIAFDGPWMAVLSHVWACRADPSSEVALYGLRDLRCHATLRFRRPDEFRKTRRRSLELSAVALCDTTVVLAAGAAGLGYVDAAPWLAEGPELVPVPTWHVREDVRTIELCEVPVKIPLKQVRFIVLPGATVCSVTAVDPRRAFAIVRRGGPDAALDSELVPLTSARR